MVRLLAMRMRLSWGFPHACGDGPFCGCPTPSQRTFSPRMWGWSRLFRMWCEEMVVFPTHVGMVRCLMLNAWRLMSFPHACGDGPSALRSCVLTGWFSPRMWGWSVHLSSPRKWQGVFPTHVGMVRAMCWRRRLHWGFPHACGDGPNAKRDIRTWEKFSPRMWGWSVVWNIP